MFFLLVSLDTDKTLYAGERKLEERENSLFLIFCKTDIYHKTDHAHHKAAELRMETLVFKYPPQDRDTGGCHRMGISSRGHYRALRLLPTMACLARRGAV